MKNISKTEDAGTATSHGVAAVFREGNSSTGRKGTVARWVFVGLVALAIYSSYQENVRKQVRSAQSEAKYQAQYDEGRREAEDKAFQAFLQADIGSGSSTGASFNAVAAGLERQYNTVSQYGSDVDKCVRAGTVAEAYLQSGDTKNYRVWTATANSDCHRAGLK